MENPECSPKLSTQQQISFLGLLPEELIVQILHRLSPLDLLSIGQVRTTLLSICTPLPRATSLVARRPPPVADLQPYSYRRVSNCASYRTLHRYGVMCGLEVKCSFRGCGLRQAGYGPLSNQKSPPPTRTNFRYLRLWIGSPMSRPVTNGAWTKTGIIPVRSV